MTVKTNTVVAGNLCIDDFEREIAQSEWILLKHENSFKYYESVGVSTFKASFVGNMEVHLRYK